MRRVVITTPTGRIARHVVDGLLAVGEPLTLIARRPERVDPAVRQAVRVVQGGFGREELTTATSDARALFLMLPDAVDVPDLVQTWHDFAGAVIDAGRRSGITRVVYISIEGASSGGPGMLGAAAAIEQELRAAFAEVVAIRPGYFMENLDHMVHALDEGVLPIPLPTEDAMPLVSTRDIGHLAARALASDAPSAPFSLIPAYGPADLSPREMAGVLTQVWGREIVAERQPLEAFRAELVAHGAMPRNADYLVDLYQVLMAPDYPFDPRTPLGTTPTTFATFARTEASRLDRRPVPDFRPR